MEFSIFQDKVLHVNVFEDEDTDTFSAEHYQLQWPRKPTTSIVLYEVTKMTFSRFFKRFYFQLFKLFEDEDTVTISAYLRGLQR